MARNYSINPFKEPEGQFDTEGEVFLQPAGSPGADPGGGSGSGSTNGTTGQVLPPGIGRPVDDKQF